MKMLKRTVIVIVLFVAVCIGIFVLMYFSRFQTVSSIEKVSSYDTGFDLYTMDVRYDYSLEDVISYGITDTQSFTDAILKEALPLLPVHIEVLDRAADTQEAVDLISDYDMLASAGRDYHFYITDASGDGRVIEYDCLDEKRPLVAESVRTVTNFYELYRDRVLPNQHNDIYGHGKERYDIIEKMCHAFL